MTKKIFVVVARTRIIGEAVHVYPRRPIHRCGIMMTLDPSKGGRVLHMVHGTKEDKCRMYWLADNKSLSASFRKLHLLTYRDVEKLTDRAAGTNIPIEVERRSMNWQFFPLAPLAHRLSFPLSTDEISSAK